jgi:hypothetical protein
MYIRGLTTQKERDAMILLNLGRKYGCGNLKYLGVLVQYELQARRKYLRFMFSDMDGIKLRNHTTMEFLQ